MSERSEYFKNGFTKNAEEFDGLMVEMLSDNERLKNLINSLSLSLSEHKHIWTEGQRSEYDKLMK